MNTSINKHQMSQPSEEIEISLTELVSTIWQGRWIIVILTAAVVLLTSACVLVTAQYKSEGLYKFGGPIPIPEALESIMK